MTKKPSVDPNACQMTVNWPDKTKDTLQIPPGFKDTLKWFLDAVYRGTGYRCSRNEFMMKSARHYLDHLLQSKNTKQLLNSLKAETPEPEIQTEKDGTHLPVSEE